MDATGDAFIRVAFERALVLEQNTQAPLHRVHLLIFLHLLIFGVFDFILQLLDRALEQLLLLDIRGRNLFLRFLDLRNFLLQQLKLCFQLLIKLGFGEPYFLFSLLLFELGSKLLNYLFALEFNLAEFVLVFFDQLL